MGTSLAGSLKSILNAVGQAEESILDGRSLGALRSNIQAALAVGVGPQLANGFPNCPAALMLSNCAFFIGLLLGLAIDAVRAN